MGRIIPPDRKFNPPGPINPSNVTLPNGMGNIGPATPQWEKLPTDDSIKGDLKEVLQDVCQFDGAGKLIPLDGLPFSPAPRWVRAKPPAFDTVLDVPGPPRRYFLRDANRDFLGIIAIVRDGPEGRDGDFAYLWLGPITGQHGGTDWSIHWEFMPVVVPD